MDIKLFYFINKNLSFYPLDIIMSFLSYIGWGGFIWIIISLYFIFFAKKEERKLGLLCLAGLILSTLVIELILKNIFCRLRPYDVLNDVNLLVFREKTFSFPSGHATSSFTSAIILGFKNRKRLVTFLILAFLISFSRIYCGVHYPSDVFFGGLIGLIIGFLVNFIYKSKVRN